MNRAQRRADKTHKPDRNKARPCAALDVFARVSPFQPDEVARLSIPVRLSWSAMCEGTGTDEDFHTLASVANVCLICAERIPGNEVVEAVQKAQDALVEMLARNRRTDKWGVDYKARESIPVVLDIYDQLLELCTPKQMQEAMNKTIERMNKGETL
jgi:hypothetical protein